MSDETTVSKSAAETGAAAEPTWCGACYRPNVDILEENDELLVQADIPGTTGENISVDFRDGTLTIHAKVPPREPTAANYLLQEYGVGDYYRTFQVSEVIDASKIVAEYHDGVLTLHLPKAESARPRKISVKTA
jgi:HSP20 family molecular chaperone IbpA